MKNSESARDPLGLNPFGSLRTELGAIFRKHNEAIVAALSGFAESMRSAPERLGTIWEAAAELGWFPNRHTTAFIQSEIETGQGAFDSYMCAHLANDWNAITLDIKREHPERSEILDCAFRLHEERCFIASIPLFYTQIDGICAERIGAHLFADKELRMERISAMLNSSGEFTGALLRTLGVKTQHSAGIRSASASSKRKAPNRNGILHGSRKHLDYATRVNSFKVFSLLAFVAYALSPRSVDA